MFPIYFRAKQGWSKTSVAEKMIASVMESNKDNLKGWFNVKKPVLDPRQDTMYFDHVFTNGWSKIEALTAR